MFPTEKRKGPFYRWLNKTRPSLQQLYNSSQCSIRPAKDSYQKQGFHEHRQRSSRQHVYALHYISINIYFKLHSKAECHNYTNSVCLKLYPGVVQYCQRWIIHTDMQYSADAQNFSILGTKYNAYEIFWIYSTICSKPHLAANQ